MIKAEVSAIVVMTGAATEAGSKCNIETSNGKTPPTTFPSIIANIIADIVIRLFDTVRASLKPGGALLVSGIIGDRVADVTESALAHGFTIDKVIEEKDWAAMVIRMGGSK